MKFSNLISIQFSKRFFAGFVGALAAFATVPAVHAANTTPKVVYSPSLQLVQGLMPLNSSYMLTVTSPSSLVGPAVVNLNVSLFADPPAGVSNTTALSFVSIVPNVVTFTGPNQSVTVLVTSLVPLGNWAGSFNYQITTSGWPAGLNYADTGAFINSQFDSPQITHQPPQIVVNAPTNQDVYTMVNGQPVTIPYAFTANTVDGTPLNTLTGTANGSALAFTPVGIGTGNATGNGSFLATTPGIYTVSGFTSNDYGVASASVQVRVNVQAGPPSVSIDTPDPNSSYVISQGGSLDVPFTFTGISQYGGVRSLSATLDGVPIAVTPSGIGNLVATGSGTMHLTSDGQYELAVTVNDDYGTAQTSTVFTVTVQAPLPPPTVIINTPDPNTSFMLPASGNVTVPFSFTGSSTGGVITNITAKLNGNPITFSTTGLNTLSATGTANLSLNTDGNYTLLVTATNNAGTATTSQDFVVNPRPSSVIKVAITNPPANSTYALGSSGNVSIPATFTSNSTAPGGVSSLSVTVNNNALNITTTATGQPTVSGNGTLKLTSAGVYTITALATDAFGSATTSENITVTSATACPNVQITSPCDGVVYTLSCDQPLWVSITLNATTNPGTTLSTLTATLNGAPITLNVTGLGTAKAKATAKVKITSTGTFTISAATSSGGVTDTDNLTFKVKSGSGGYTWGDNSHSGSWDNDNSCWSYSYGWVKYPTPCNVNWQQSWSCNTTQKGGNTLPICFQVQYTGSSCLSNWYKYFSDFSRNDDYYSCDNSDRDTWNRYGFYNCLGTTAPSSSTCMNNKWDYVGGCKVSNDASVRVLVYEVKSNGSCGTPQTFTCGKSAKGTNYVIGSGDQYQFNFATAKGTHTYRCDVYYYKGSSTTPTFLGSQQFCTK